MAVLSLPMTAARTMSAATTSFVQGRVSSDTGAGVPQAALSLDTGTAGASTTAPGGLFVFDGLFAGTRDRFRASAGAFAPFVGPTVYAGAKPRQGLELLGVEAASLGSWAAAFDSDGTLDASLGIVFGEVKDGAGAPVAGATVSLEPPGGDAFYFTDDGDPDASAVVTGATGRFLVLNVPPGFVKVAGSNGGVVYGRAIAGTVSGLSPEPPAAVAGSATDETGGAVSSALVTWDFDPAIVTTTDGAGGFSLTGIAQGLDASLRGLAPGYRTALSFRRGLAEVADPSAVGLGFLSDAAYAAYPAALGIVQAPQLGMIFGRVLAADGSPLANAVVTTDPAVDQAQHFLVRYFDASGAPDPSLNRTSPSGRFIVLNVPTGLVSLSAVGPGQTIRAEAATSEAGAVTSGELRGLRTVSVTGVVNDELRQTSTIAGAVVSLAEYPFLATIADSTGKYTLSGVPAGELVTFKVSRDQFKDSYSFMAPAPDADLECPGDSDTDGTSDRSDCKDLFAISSKGYADQYSQALTAANRTLALVGAHIALSNGVGPIGFLGQLTPPSGTIRYLSDSKFGKDFVTTIGSVQIFNASPAVSGFVFSDPRTDTAQLALARIAPDSVSLSPTISLGCDTDSDGTLTNIYPCNGSSITSAAKDLFFLWRKGATTRFQVQFSADPSFATVALTSAASSGTKFIKTEYWHMVARVLKRLKKLKPASATGSFPVYWRILAQDADKNESMSAPFVLYLP